MKKTLTPKNHNKQNLVLKDILTFNGSIRIPVSGSFTLAEEVRMIIDTNVFQRLRGVRQLGPTHFVYPGAIHTRFEHSLGTYALSLRYVEKLLEQKEFYSFSHNASELSKLLIASALLHDIGHYPFSHLIEEIGELSNFQLEHHEVRAESIILNTEISFILEKHWKINPAEVASIIRTNKLSDGLGVIGSALSGLLDLDKMDYLIRDSIHCGVNFGLALDIERFLTGLRIDKANACVCLSAKAASYIPTLIMVRNLMYNEVYWHKTVRACSAMLKTLIFRLIKTKILKKDELFILLKSQDDRVAFRLNELAEMRKDEQLTSLAKPFIFEGRGLFKMIYFFGLSVSNGKPKAKNYLDEFLKYPKTPFSRCIEKAEVLQKAIKSMRPKIQQGDILLEFTPIKSSHEKFDLANMRLLDERTGKHIKSTDLSNESGNMPDFNRRVFVFCHPKRARMCSDITDEEWENIFHKASQELRQ